MGSHSGPGLIMDMNLSDLFQGGQTAVALYLAIQIRGILNNHEIRISALEQNRRPKRKAKARK